MSIRIGTSITHHEIFDRRGLRQIKEGGKWMREQGARATWQRRALPDLVLVGVQRSGTTALTEALYRLSNVERPRLGKGSHYFSYNYHRGWPWFQSQFPTSIAAAAVERFKGRPLFCFDACPYYLFHPFAVERMAQALPEVKVLVMLRDPVRRAESHYHHSVTHGHEELDFEEAVAAESKRLAGEDERMQQDWTYWSHGHEHHSYISKGMYADQLERLFRFYPTDQVKVLQSEAFYRNADTVLAEVTDWLNLPAVTLDPADDRNANQYKPMDEKIRASLTEIYREPNERLFALLGTRYDWIS